MSLFGCCGPVKSAPRYPYLFVLTTGDRGVPIESDGHSKDNPRLYELIENAPKTGKSPTVWAWPQLIDYLKIAGQPVSGPWPPHQEPRPDPDYESGPQAVPDPNS
jgi:hypothetical protein